MLRRPRWLLVGLVVLATPFIGAFVYLNVIRDDAPKRLSLDDVTTTTSRAGATSSTGAAGIDGSWTVAPGSIVGYRVQETLFGQSAEAVGRSSGVTGSVTAAGGSITQATFEVDMATFESSESRRDGQFNGRIMEVDRFPTAQFRLTSPIELGAEPAEGVEVAVEATGELTLHGVTKPLTIPLTGRRTDETFAVAGSVTVVFADFGIANPSAGPAVVGDEGELEVLLILER